jgi:predicted nucleotide-binding protein
MKKSTCWYGVHFDVAALRTVEKKFREVLSKGGTKPTQPHLQMKRPEETWSFDTLEEFYAAAHESLPSIQWSSENLKYMLSLTATERGNTLFDVSAPTRDEIDAVFAALEEHKLRCHIPNYKKQNALKIFIGHGNDEQWKQLKDHLHEKHKLQIEAYEIGSRAGHTIRDILDRMLEESSLALLVMTGEDKTDDGSIHPRLNVVHEAGLFQGKLGFEHAIVLLEDGTTEFSNIHGLQQIRFAKGHIDSTFGEVLAVVRREFGSMF